MRLGTDTASFHNYLLSGTKGQPIPEVGMGATILMWTDRHACTIVKVVHNGWLPPKKIAVQRDHAKRTDDRGMSDAQSYEYSPNTEAPIEWFSLRKDGAYVKVGASINGYRLRIGDRKEYYDYSF